MPQPPVTTNDIAEAFEAAEESRLRAPELAAAKAKLNANIHDPRAWRTQQHIPVEMTPPAAPQTHHEKANRWLRGQEQT